ncbi:hypothetical protein L210DRAFT_2262114 [Boletus edulis BED1]|uniref:Uncharacterized protein n=1 Tax=Boletus edulis BED1 TaxID=1328754 RepID=A0AAD4GD38_BOLED|nr:hypothetical protein L210DRAFT_2262114 [Boletus edulis BED1]
MTDEIDMNVAASPATLPPRMRKAWSQHPVGQVEPPQGNLPLNHSTPAESWRAHERWRSPPDTIAESPISVSGAAEGSSGSGKGNRRKQNLVSVNGDGEDGVDGQETDFDTETEADGLDDTRQMPPPPMPASLDPTTVSSLAHAQAASSASPRSSIQWDKNSVSATWIPPQTSTSVSSERSSQTPTPSQGTFSATPAPPHPTVTRSSLASQANHGTLSPSISFSPATQSPVQSHPSPLVPGVSPSTTFSKLSLHSPDASSTPHLPILCSPNESASIGTSASASTRDSDNHASSPRHRPSKPLHVHAQNEPPSLPTSTPMVSLDSPDGTRDTPAETQYQQPYRSSPESGHEIHLASDVEKRPTNGDVYRVRFASPEILNGMPRLRGRATSDNSKPLDSHDGVSSNADETVKEKEASPWGRDAMDVEVDVIGDNQAQDGGGPSIATSSEGRINHVSDAPGSPSQAPPDSRPQIILSVEDGTAPARDSSLTVSNVNEMTSQGEPMIIDPAPPQPPREPSPPPPPKVKMSLKDFALRKKKQREEEMAAKALSSPATPDGPILPPSPNVDVKRDLASEHVSAVPTSDSGGVVNSQDVEMADVKEDVLDTSETVYVNANGFDGVKVHGHDALRDLRSIDKKVTAEDNKRLRIPQQLRHVFQKRGTTRIRCRPKSTANLQ